MTQEQADAGLRCAGCGQTSFRIYMDGYHVEKAVCNGCETVTRFRTGGEKHD